MRRSPVLALLVVLPILAFLAGCGASAGDDADSVDKTSTAAETSDEGDPGDDTTGDGTTTTAADGDDPGTGVTSAALAEILPTEDDLPDGYTMSDEDLGDSTDADDEADDESSTDDEDPTEQAIIDACPGAEILEQLDNSSDANTDEVSREFETEADATIEVALDPTPEGFDEDTVDQVVEALSDCEKIETEDEEGNAITMEIKAETYDDHGDFGLAMTMTAEFSMMGMTVPIEFKGLIFDVDGTTVSVVATSGLDDATFESVPGDYDALPDLAALMQDRVGSL
ncbi:MAG: hypothetical protein JWO77_2995 [Ilumatobacteraceae bacterium]|nr:hypothetical protein [Ilumatobacteraceae bacterium]